MKQHVKVYLTLIALTIFSYTLFSQSNLQLKISIPNVLKRPLTSSDSIYQVDITLINRTDGIASFYEDWNMWGYYNMRFVLYSNLKTDTIHRYDKMWDKNFPTFIALLPGDSMMFHYNLEKEYPYHVYGATITFDSIQASYKCFSINHFPLWDRCLTERRTCPHLINESILSTIGSPDVNNFINDPTRQMKSFVTKEILSNILQFHGKLTQ